MPLKLLSPGGGSVLLQANTTSLDYTLTVPAETANLITTATTSGINASAISAGTLSKPRLPSGSVLQVVSTSKTDVFTTASTSWTDLTGMSVSITPTLSTSKILVNVCLCFIGDGSTQGYCRIVRDSSAIGIGDANGSRVRFSLNNYVLQMNEVRTSSLLFYDSPATTSATTYKLQLQSQGTGTVYVNRSTTWVDSQQSGTGISTITVMEIAV